MLDSNPFILRCLVNSDSLAEARRNMFDYLSQCENAVLGINCPLHPLEQKNVRDCIKVFRTIISESSEQKTSHSCLNTLWIIATEHWRQQEWPGISEAFLAEMKHLFMGVVGLSGIYSKSGICKREVPAFVNLKGRECAVSRSQLLNKKVDKYITFIKKKRLYDRYRF